MTVRWCLVGCVEEERRNRAASEATTGRSRWITTKGWENYDLSSLVKDLGIIKELTDQLGLELPVTKASSSVVDTTMSLGLNEPDIAATALSIKKLSNID